MKKNTSKAGRQSKPERTIKGTARKAAAERLARFGGDTRSPDELRKYGATLREGAADGFTKAVDEQERAFGLPVCHPLRESLLVRAQDHLEGATRMLHEAEALCWQADGVTRTAPIVGGRCG